LHTQLYPEPLRASRRQEGLSCQAPYADKRARASGQNGCVLFGCQQQRSAGPASRILFAWAPTSRAPQARREIAGFRPGSWPQGQFQQPSSPGARPRLCALTLLGASLCTPGPSARKPLPTRGRWSERLPRAPGLPSRLRPGASRRQGACSRCCPTAALGPRSRCSRTSVASLPAFAASARVGRDAVYGCPCPRCGKSSAGAARTSCRAHRTTCGSSP
jgi:hypothetical protein